MDSKARVNALSFKALQNLFERRSKPVKLDAGTVLFEEGDPGDGIFSLDFGRLEVSVLSEDGRKLVLDIVRPDSFIGEIALFDPGPRTATLTALEPVRLRRLQTDVILDEIRDNPEVAIELIRLAGVRMRWMNNQLEEQVFLSLAARLARRILYLTEPENPELRLNQSQLGEFVGATREGVSNILRNWKQNGVLELTRGGLVVLDRTVLEEIANNETPL